jgi:hypothetical protein
MLLGRTYKRSSPESFGDANSIEHSLGRWAALMRYMDDGDLPIDSSDPACSRCPSSPALFAPASEPPWS